MVKGYQVTNFYDYNNKIIFKFSANVFREFKKKASNHESVVKMKLWTQW